MYRRKRHKKNNSEKTVAIAIACGIVVLGCGALILLTAPTDVVETIPVVKHLVTTNSSYHLTKRERAQIMAETAYTGASGSLPDAVFDYEFKKTDAYVSNKELSNDSTVSGDLTGIKKEAVDFTTAMFNTTYRTLESKEDTYVSKLVTYMGGSGASTIWGSDKTEESTIDDSYTTEDYARGLAQYYIDNKLEVEANYTTDTCLVYEDNGVYYVRGILKITSYENSENKTSPFLPEGLDLTQDGKYVFEVGLTPTTDYTKYTNGDMWDVISMEVLGKA